MGEKWEMAVVETSAKNNRDVDRVFQEIAQMIYDKYKLVNCQANKDILQDSIFVQDGQRSQSFRLYNQNTNKDKCCQ